MNFRTIAASIVAAIAIVAPAQAGTQSNPYGTTYGYGENYFDICNETNESIVTFYTDETDHEHWLEIGECDRIYTNWDFIVVDFDNSWQYGDQFTSVTVDFPMDLSLTNAGQDKFGEKIGFRVW